ncbi:MULTISPECIES: ribosome maturation factor RimM [unclassified Xanthobacter]|uniref:ribosome maturation factor RimM n=1 Tax=unclassified Xanthobacter TaxID=2623496 RepID=UPI001EEAEC73
MTERILVARIGAPHGVRGEVRLFIFTEDPGAVLDYEPLTDAEGRRKFAITTLRPAKDHFVARLAGVDDRNAAEALTNVDLYVPRDALPPAEDDDTFYHADLLGLRVENEAGEPIGTVMALHDFGAGDVLEYAPAGTGRGRTLMVPFTRLAVPVVDVPGGRVVLAADFIDKGNEQPEPGEDTADG